jgi:hypothetical protein
MNRKIAESAKNSIKTLNINNLPLSKFKKYKEIIFDNKLK